MGLTKRLTKWMTVRKFELLFTFGHGALLAIVVCISVFVDEYATISLSGFNNYGMSSTLSSQFLGEMAFMAGLMCFTWSLGVVLVYLLFIKFRLKVLQTYFPMSVIVLSIGWFLSWLVGVLSGGGYTPVIGTISVEDILFGGLIGLFFGSLTYFCVAKVKRPIFVGILFVTLFANVIVESTFSVNYDQNVWTWFQVAFVIVYALVWIGSLFLYVCVEFKLREKELVKKATLFLLLGFFFGVVSFGVAKVLNDYFDLIQDQISLLQDMRSHDIVFEPTLPAPDDGSVSESVGMEPPSSMNISVVGMYQADVPVYLKTEVFDLDRPAVNGAGNSDDGSLVVKPADIKGKLYKVYRDDPWEYFTEYVFEYGEEAYSPIDSISVIYKYGNGGANGETDYEDQNNTEQVKTKLPTAYFVYEFETQLYDRELGLFGVDLTDVGKGQDTAKVSGLDRENGVWYGKYSYYTSFRGTGFYDSATTTSSQEGYGFAEVSSQSERFNEIRDLTESIIEAKRVEEEDNICGDDCKARAVEEYLQDNYTYTLSPHIADQANPIDDFILDGKRGYCTHFAAAMVIMLESVDIDARMVAGFHSSFYDDDLDAYIMFSTDLHAWVEVYDPMRFTDGVSWYTYDPTPVSYGCDGGQEVEQSAWDDVKRNYILNDVDPVLSFDDIYDEQTVDTRVFDEFSELGRDPSTRDSEWGGELSEEELREQMEERQRAMEKQKEKMEKTWQVVKYILLGVLVLVLLGWIGVLIYRRLSNVLQVDRNADKDLMRKLDKKIRLRFKDKLELSGEDLKISSKSFLERLNEIEGVSDELVQCYQHLNRVLYAQEYSPDDVVVVVSYSWLSE